MHLLKDLSKNELKLLKDAGVSILDKEYSKEELRECELKIEEFIMNHSSKNGELSNYNIQYSDILNNLIKYQQ